MLFTRFYYSIALALTFSLCLSFSACTDDNDPNSQDDDEDVIENSVSFVLNSSQLIIFNDINVEETGARAYVDSVGTEIRALGQFNGDPCFLSINYESEGTDTIQYSFENNFNDNPNYFSLVVGNDQYIVDDILLKVNEYGEVGELVKGVFTGTMDDGLFSTAVITQGQFEILRKE